MFVMYKMNHEKREKYSHKIDKMIEFLEEFKDCLDDGEYVDEPEYRGGRMYRHEYHEDDGLSGRYGYRRGRM